MNTQLLVALVSGVSAFAAGVTTVALSTRASRRQNADTVSAQTMQARWREEGLLAGERWKHYEWLDRRLEEKDRRIDELLEEVRALKTVVAELRTQLARLVVHGARLSGEEGG